MRYTYKVMELGPEILDPKTNEIHVNVGESKQMEAMSLKKLNSILIYMFVFYERMTKKLCFKSF